MTIADILKTQPVMPVLTIDDVAAGVDLVKALAAGGLTTVEITMRTPVALDAVKAIVSEVENVKVGVGTALDTCSWSAAVSAGAAFIVSPGTTR